MPNQAQLLVKIVLLVFNVHKTEWNHLFLVVMVLMPTQLVYQVVKPVQQVIIVVIHVRHPNHATMVSTVVLVLCTVWNVQLGTGMLGVAFII